MGDVRYGRFSVRTECPHCGQPLPLNGLTLVLSCAYCHREVNLPAGLWRPVLEAFDERHERMTGSERSADILELEGFHIRYEYGPGRPTCEKCNAAYAVEQLVGKECNFACVECGDPASTEVAPNWLRESLPTARQIYSVDPKSGDPGTDALELRSYQDAVKPIAMSCPSCGGGLQITAENERLVPCKFCQSDIYLPDAVWRRLHPIKMVQPFFVLFEGPSRAQLARQREEESRQQEAERFRVAGIESDARLARERERMQQVKEAKRQEAERLLARAWRASKFAVAMLALLVSWIYSAEGLFSMPALSDQGLTVTFVLAVLAIVATIVAMHRVGKPVSLASGYGFEWLLFITWFWLPFMMMPVVGPLLALWRGIALYRGKFSAATIETNGSRSSYGEVVLKGGEGKPGGILFFAIAILGFLIWMGGLVTAL